jgi:hypothetical protein
MTVDAERTPPMQDLMYCDTHRARHPRSKFGTDARGNPRRTCKRAERKRRSSVNNPYAKTPPLPFTPKPWGGRPLLSENHSQEVEAEW